MAAKALTQWYPAGGVGYVIAQPGLNIQDNHGNLLVDNHSNNLIPNPSYVQGKYLTGWSVPAHS